MNVPAESAAALAFVGVIEQCELPVAPWTERLSLAAAVVVKLVVSVVALFPSGYVVVRFPVPEKLCVFLNPPPVSTSCGVCRFVLLIPACSAVPIDPGNAFVNMKVSTIFAVQAVFATFTSPNPPPLDRAAAYAPEPRGAAGGAIVTV